MSRNQKVTPGSSFSRRSFVQGAASATTLLYGALGARSESLNTFRHVGDKRAIVIGSGFGGAVASLRLTENSIETLLLERGRRWPLSPDGNTFSPYLPPDGRSTWLSRWTPLPFGPAMPVKRYVGVLEGRNLGGLSILQAAAFGGGSIVYGGLHVKPTKAIFEQVFPEEVSWEAVQPYFDRFAERVGISPTPKDILNTDYYKHYRIVEEQAQRAGLKTERVLSATDWDVVRDEISGKLKPSAIHGEAVYGVNSGAKKTLDRNYLADAEASGYLEIKTLHQVVDAAFKDGKYHVFAEIIDEAGNVIDRVRYSCDYLFLAAGCVGTTSLLVKAKANGNLPNLNEEIGEGFGNNGNVYALRSQFLTSTGKWQGGPPSLGIQDFDNPISPIFIEHPQLPLGLDIRTLLYFGVGLNPTRGRFYFDKQTNRVELAWPKRGNGQANVNAAMLHTMKKLNKVNGGIINPLLFGRNLKDDAVYHPLGGAVMGKACDFFGRVNGYQRLYVMDSALIPGSTACANPAFTIAALAERNMENVIQNDF